LQRWSSVKRYGCCSASGSTSGRAPRRRLPLSGLFSPICTQIVKNLSIAVGTPGGPTAGYIDAASSPLDYSRSPKNPALQQLQKSSKSASTTPLRPIWNTFATVGVRDFWENGCICHREPIDTAIAHRPPESGHRWAFFCPSKDPSKYTLRWGLVNFHCLLRDQPNTDAQVILDN